MRNLNFRLPGHRFPQRFWMLVVCTLPANYGTRRVKKSGIRAHDPGEPASSLGTYRRDAPQFGQNYPDCRLRGNEGKAAALSRMPRCWSAAAARFFIFPNMRRRQRLRTARSLADNPAIAAASKSSAMGMRWFTSDWPFGDSLTVTSRLLLAERVRVTRPLRTRRLTSRDKVETSMLVRSAKSI